MNNNRITVHEGDWLLKLLKLDHSLPLKTVTQQHGLTPVLYLKWTCIKLYFFLFENKNETHIQTVFSYHVSSEH